MTLASFQDVSGLPEKAVEAGQPRKSANVIELKDAARSDREASDKLWPLARLLRDEWRDQRYRRLFGG